MEEDNKASVLLFSENTSHCDDLKSDLQLFISSKSPVNLQVTVQSKRISSLAPLRMLRLSLPQKGSFLGTSSPSAVEQGLRSGDEGMAGTWSCGDLQAVGEVVEGVGGEVAVGVGVWGVCADVGLLVADWGLLQLMPDIDNGLVRSRPTALAVMGEWRDSLRVRTGEEVWDGMDKGGGDENLRQRRGDLSFMCSPPLLF